MQTDFLSLLVVGIVATGYMTMVHWLADIKWLGMRSVINAIGSFFMPDTFESRMGTLVLHFLAGVAFTAVYAFVFEFLQPTNILAYVRTGLLMGMLHGFFLGVFFNAFDPVTGLDGFQVSTAAINIASHIVFGVLVGLGLGITAHTGTAMWFAAYGIAGLIVAGFVLRQLGHAVFKRGGRRHRRRYARYKLMRSSTPKSQAN